MPLDYPLIEDSKIYSQIRLNNAVETISPDLLFVTDFIYPPLLTKLLGYISNDSLDWQAEIYQESKNRAKLNWTPDTVLEETHIVLDSLTDQLNQTYNKQTRFLGLSIWKDQQGYTIRPHVDQPLISISLQVYLSESSEELDTRFLYDGKVIGPGYNKNSGYIQNNVGITHFMVNPVPAEHVRYSLYAIWTDSK